MKKGILFLCLLWLGCTQPMPKPQPEPQKPKAKQSEAQKPKVKPKESQQISKKETQKPTSLVSKKPKPSVSQPSPSPKPSPPKVSPKPSPSQPTSKPLASKPSSPKPSTAKPLPKPSKPKPSQGTVSSTSSKQQKKPVTSSKKTPTSAEASTAKPLKPTIPKISPEVLMKKAWQEARKRDTQQAYELFLKRFPKSPFAKKAKIRLELVKERNFFESHKGTIQGYESYLKRYPHGRFAAKAKEELEKLYFEQAKRNNSLESWDQFLAKFPKGKLYQEALKLRKQLLLQKVEKAFLAIQRIPDKKKQIHAWETFRIRFAQKPFAEVSSPYLQKAKQAILSLEVDILKEEGNPHSYYQYLKKHPRHPKLKELRQGFHKAILRNLLGKSEKKNKWALFYYKFLCRSLFSKKSLTSLDLTYFEHLGLTYASLKKWGEAFLVYTFSLWKARQQGESENSLLPLTKTVQEIFWKYYQTRQEDRNPFSLDRSFLSRETPKLEISRREQSFLEPLVQALLQAAQSQPLSSSLLLFVKSWNHKDCLQILEKVAKRHPLSLPVLEGVLTFGEEGRKKAKEWISQKNPNLVTHALLILGYRKDKSVLSQVLPMSFSSPSLQVARDYYLLRLGDEGARLRLIQALFHKDLSTARLAAFSLRYSQKSLPLPILEKGLERKDSFIRYELLSLLPSSFLTSSLVEKLLQISEKEKWLQKKLESLLLPFAKAHPDQWLSLWKKFPLHSLSLRIGAKLEMAKAFQQIQQIRKVQKEQGEVFFSLLESLLYLKGKNKLKGDYPLKSILEKIHSRKLDSLWKNFSKKEKVALLQVLTRTQRTFLSSFLLRQLEGSHKQREWSRWIQWSLVKVW